jgi:hypothetical protein
VVAASKSLVCSSQSSRRSQYSDVAGRVYARLIDKRIRAQLEAPLPR